RERQVVARHCLALRGLAVAELQRHGQRAERVLELVRGDGQRVAGVVAAAVVGVHAGAAVAGVRAVAAAAVVRAAHVRSTMVEIPCPTPMHIVARPRRAPGPRRASSWSSVVTRRAPEQPSGWPMAIAPPLTFTFSGSRPS